MADAGCRMPDAGCLPAGIGGLPDWRITEIADWQIIKFKDLPFDSKDLKSLLLRHRL